MRSRRLVYPQRDEELILRGNGEATGEDCSRAPYAVRVKVKESVDEGRFAATPAHQQLSANHRLTF